jgi:precorrin isomerase
VIPHGYGDGGRGDSADGAAHVGRSRAHGARVGPTLAPSGSTRTAAGLLLAWQELAAVQPAPLVLIGSAPTALEVLLKQVEAGSPRPSLVIGMPVGLCWGA